MTPECACLKPDNLFLCSQESQISITLVKMAASSDLEKKNAAVDGTSADDRSTAEGQVYGSEELHAGLNRERRYGKSESTV